MEITSYIPSEADCGLVKQGLDNYNRKMQAPLHEEVLRGFKILGAQNEIMGEAIVEVFCGSLEIKMLYIAEGNKGQGIGSKLIKVIETYNYGVELKSAFVWTTTWQAAGFYSKCGYNEKTRVLLNTQGLFNEEPQYDILFYKEFN